MFTINSLLLCLTIILILIIISLIIIRNKSNNSSIIRSIVVVMGSGGHTSEMIALFSQLNFNSNDLKSSKVHFMTSSDDILSQQKVKQNYKSIIDCNLITIRRSRSVGQNYLTSIVTTIESFIDCLIVCYKLSPQLIVCNGPGVCIPVCFAAKLLSSNVIIVFVESFCRTESLSLSGKILYYSGIADHYLVQWPQLNTKYNRTKYIGLLV